MTSPQLKALRAFDALPRLHELAGLPTLDTPRLRLRALAPADDEALLALFSDERSLETWITTGRWTLDDARAFRESAAAGAAARSSFIWGVFEREAAGDGGRLVGAVFLVRWAPHHRRVDLGYYLSSETWGRGLATEAARAALGFAFGTLGVWRVEAETTPDNEASKRVMRRLGFRYEARLEGRLAAGDRPLDADVFRLLRPEFDAAAPPADATPAAGEPARDPFGSGLPTLRGARVTLRMPTASDAPDVLRVFGDSDNVRYWSHGPMADLAEAERYVAAIHDGWRDRSLFQWAVTLPPDGRLVGTVTLNGWAPEHRRAEIGFILRRDLHGQGIARDAVETVLAFADGPMALHRVEADVDPDNAASLALLARLGFEQEGYARRRWFTYGTWKDSVLLARLAPDASPP